MVEEEAVVLERRVEAPRLRRVVDVALVLQRRDRHPDEREREHDRERHDDAVARTAAGAHALRHVTSARRAKTSISDRHEREHRQHEERDRGALAGVPGVDPGLERLGRQHLRRVERAAVREDVRDDHVGRREDDPEQDATIAIGSCSGSDTYQNFFRPVAPSIAAASSTSCGIDAIPARKITVANGIVRHAWTKMIDGHRARSACRARSALFSGSRRGAGGRGTR